MPTASEASTAEAHRWSEVASRWGEERARELWDDRPPTERAVIVFYDPVRDLAKRASNWGYELEGPDLRSLALFAAALARAEAEGWQTGTGDVATRAYEARRFLLADRILHWAVPWLDAAARWFPRFSDSARADRDFLLDLGDDMRVAPIMPGSEGLVVEGEDSYGRIGRIGDRDRWVSSLWSGYLMLWAEWDSISDAGRQGPSPKARLGDLAGDELAVLYEVAANRWTELAERHPGSAQMWADLAERARATSRYLGE